MTLELNTIRKAAEIVGWFDQPRHAYVEGAAAKAADQEVWDALRKDSQVYADALAMALAREIWKRAGKQSVDPMWVGAMLQGKAMRAIRLGVKWWEANNEQ